MYAEQEGYDYVYKYVNSCHESDTFFSISDANDWCEIDFIFHTWV